MTPSEPEKPELLGPEPVDGAVDRLAHLAENRRLIIRRSLLASAVGGLVPIPVMDDYAAGRVRAWLLMTLANRRQVDLALSSAELLADPREGTTLRNATITAATMVALRLAWRKFFAILALGRRAEDMATSFQTATLFDHYCAKLHVGPGIDRPRAFRLRTAMHASLAAVHRDKLVGAFRDAAGVLGRSVLEAPAWLSARATKLAERFARSGGNPAAAVDPAFDEPDGDDRPGQRFIDRAAQTAEDRMAGLGHHYLEALIADFEQRWREVEAADAAAAEKGAAAAEQR